jgi:hypothetical protein
MITPKGTMRDGLPMLRVPVSHEGVALPQRRHDWIERALAKSGVIGERQGAPSMHGHRNVWTPECLQRQNGDGTSKTRSAPPDSRTARR